MEGIVQLDKTKDFERSKEIVKEMIKDDELTEELYDKLTDEIMDTCMFIGGDFAEETVRGVCEEYIKKNALPRFKRAHWRD